MKTAVSNEFILEAHKSACNEWKLKNSVTSGLKTTPTANKLNNQYLI